MRMFISLVLLGMFAVAVGCSGTQVVLLPDPDGEVGALQVSNSVGSQVLDDAQEGTKVSGRDSEPSTPSAWDMDDIRSKFEEAIAAQPAVPAKFLLYFLHDSDVLTGVSEELLPDILNEVQARNSMDISINGHSDRMGDETYNIDLSLRRARAIFNLLLDEGVIEDHMDVTSHGEGNPLIPTADNVSEPKNRRVEVIVR
ncbi:MAG: OmpA family protein [Desulfovibrio sp.]|nr:MAG: OmpA family protein [Desulfovibrio sp.]